MTYDTKISDLKEDHPFIYYTALNRYQDKNQDNGKCSQLAYFIWSNTIEGQYIWSQVCHGNYQPFYEFHKRENPVANIPDFITKIFNKQK